MKEELLKGLTEEQIAKVKACETTEKLLEVVKAEGIELTDEQLEAVSGGGCSTTAPSRCPKCGSTDLEKGDSYLFFKSGSYHRKYICRNCKHGFFPGASY